MTVESTVKIEGRINPFTGEQSILFVENQPKGFVANVKKFVKWPVKLSNDEAVKLQKKINDDEAKELWG